MSGLLVLVAEVTMHERSNGPTCRKLSAGADVREKGCHSYLLMSPHWRKTYCPGLHDAQAA